MPISLKTAAFTLISAALGLMSVSSPAATIVQSGNTYGGWEITVPAGVALDVDSTSGNTLVLEKFATFTSTTPLTIEFTQVSAGALPVIEFANEQVTNLSGSNWTGFQYQLSGMPNGIPSTFQGSLVSDTPEGTIFVANTFAPPPGFGAPNSGFTSITYSGSQPNGTTESWGFGPSAPGLFIEGIALSIPQQPTGHHFDFTESPLTNPVPLPASAWQSLTGLFGLGLIAVGRNVRKAILAPSR
jgi:hypothetical protein